MKNVHTCHTSVEGLCVTEGWERWPGGAWVCKLRGDDIQVPRKCLQGEI